MIWRVLVPALFVAVLVVLVLLVVTDTIDLGVKSKTAWDWLDVLAVPLAVAGIAFWGAAWARNDARRRAGAERQSVIDRESEARTRADVERELTSEREREAAFRGYIGLMTNLLLDRQLRETKANAVERAIARAQTLDVLRGLDGRRKGMLVRFLSELELLRDLGTIISLAEADLSYADLREVVLAKADLYRAILTSANLLGADLSDARLDYANLQFANMRETDFSDAILVYADLSHGLLRNSDLSGSDLTGANLSDADLQEASLANADMTRSRLSDADLSYADLKGANLTGADLKGANLTDAEVTRDQLSRVDDLVGATLPDGSTVTQKIWGDIKFTSRN